LLNLAVGALVAPFAFGDLSTLLAAMVIGSVCTGCIAYLPWDFQALHDDDDCRTTRTCCCAIASCVGTFFFFFFGFVILYPIFAIKNTGIFLNSVICAAIFFGWWWSEGKPFHLCTGCCGTLVLYIGTLVGLSYLKDPVRSGEISMSTLVGLSCALALAAAALFLLDGWKSLQRWQNRVAEASAERGDNLPIETHDNPTVGNMSPTNARATVIGVISADGVEVDVQQFLAATREAAADRTRLRAAELRDKRSAQEGEGGGILQRRLQAAATLPADAATRTDATLPADATLQTDATLQADATVARAGAEAGVLQRRVAALREAKTASVVEEQAIERDQLQAELSGMSLLALQVRLPSLHTNCRTHMYSYFSHCCRILKVRCSWVMAEACS
jgi:hypothetical protein